MRCKNCKFWKKEEPNNCGTCESGKIKYLRQFNCLSHDMQNVAPEDFDSLLYLDYEGYNAYHVTGPDFGCIHWEQEANDARIH